MSHVTDHQEAIEKVRELIKDIDTAMLTTISDDGLVSRPMKTQDVEFDGDLWFLTKKDTSKFHEILHNRQVNVAYVDKSYVSIRGNAELVDSPEKIKEFWNAAYEKLLDCNYDDPSLVLIKVKADTAEYWDSSNKFKMMSFMFRRLMGKDADDSEINKVVDLP
ncbi:pyridoxamine 5'-phosphate oxidase family protein [Paenibacillus lemnae]|uniref:Pyridoxamine 5'-phosphate oxidase family protein n=1 Tax=Paenibacillus lemnae TaxID=1330551 RepID=A0A848MBZ9_PAELE|nr:pyridoxamine 5'-phosphate oxidase family protein [Paenibacillus lemnae]NMO98026.1 pyridoxamine 5'-phosphate oxidase family protein [Paenibacillus lemnae]